MECNFFFGLEYRALLMKCIALKKIVDLKLIEDPMKTYIHVHINIK